MPKAEGAFRTIGEVSAELGIAQHILRYWETRFAQLRPLQRAGNRRYYRPEDVALIGRIDRLLNHEGYTIRGVQKLLAEEAPASATAAIATMFQVAPAIATADTPVSADPARSDLIAELRAIRATLAEALARS